MGYTSIVVDKEHCTFEEFVWRCARAMGANVDMRDEVLEALPGRFVPSAFYAEQISKTQAEIYDLERLIPYEAEVRARVRLEHERAVEFGRVAEAGRRVRRAKYEAMLMQVIRWEPPTLDHAGLKEFMIQQLSESIHWEGTAEESPVPPAPDGKQWLKDRLTKARADLDYWRERECEEIARVAERNAWNDALRASVPFPPREEAKP